MAKFEVCCHSFADLSEHNYGVSILNDSKYGFATVGNVMRLSLLRSPKAPDGNADMGRHQISWAMMPHRGGLGAQTVQAARNFNNPLRLFTAEKDMRSDLSKQPIVLKGDANLVLDWVKRGEDDEDVSTDNLPRRGEQNIIVRVYDAVGGMGRGTIETTFAVKKVFKTNILEDDLEEITVHDGTFEIVLAPFEVSSFRLVLES